MVLYDELTTNKYDGRYYVLYLYDLEQNIPNNTSTLSWRLEAVDGYNGWYAERDLKVVINGITVFSKTDRVERYTGLIKSGSITIQHNSNGSKTIAASIEAAVYGSAINVKGSKNIVLEAIARQATITYSPNFFDTGNPTINYNNPMGSAADEVAVCISLTGAKDDVAYRAVSKTGSSYTFNLTESERNVLRNASPNSNTLTIRYYIKTTIGGINYHNYANGTMTIVEANPTFTINTYDTNSKTIALTGNNKKLIRYNSNLNYTITATALKGASITNYSVRNGNKTLTTSTGVFNNFDGYELEVVITDSRGNITRENVYPDIIKYVPITCNIDSGNILTNGTLSTKLNGLYYNGSLGATSNKLTLYYRVYEDGKIDKPAFKVAEYRTYNNSYSQPVYEATIGETGLDYRLNYIVEAYATDKLMDRVDAVPYTVSSYPVFDWSATDFNFNVPVNFSAGATGVMGDYGEWIPSLNASAISSYTNQEGWYMKQGKVITVGFYIKANCNTGHQATILRINGLPFKPSIAASGGGMCSGTYVSSGFTFQCWVAGTDGNITSRVQQVNHTTATNLATSASGCFYRNNGGEITLSGTIIYITNEGES